VNYERLQRGIRVNNKMARQEFPESSAKILNRCVIAECRPEKYLLLAGCR